MVRAIRPDAIGRASFDESLRTAASPRLTGAGDFSAKVRQNRGSLRRHHLSKCSCHRHVIQGYTVRLSNPPSPRTATLPKCDLFRSPKFRLYGSDGFPTINLGQLCNSDPAESPKWLVGFLWHRGGVLGQLTKVKQKDPENDEPTEMPYELVISGFPIMRF